MDPRKQKYRWRGGRPDHNHFATHTYISPGSDPHRSPPSPIKKIIHQRSRLLMFVVDSSRLRPNRPHHWMTRRSRLKRIKLHKFYRFSWLILLGQVPIKIEILFFFCASTNGCEKTVSDYNPRQVSRISLSSPGVLGCGSFLILLTSLTLGLLDQRRCSMWLFRVFFF